MIKIICLLTFNFKSRLHYRAPADMPSETTSTASPLEFEVLVLSELILFL